MSVSKVVLRGRQRWRARIKCGGKMLTAFRDRKDEAEEAERDLRAKVAKPKPTREVPTLEKFASEYLEKCETQNRPQYARKKRQILDVQLIPVFGAMKLDEIGARQIDAYRAKRMKEKAGGKWINEIVGVLMHMLRTASEWEIIDKVPKVRPLKVAISDFDYLEEPEIDRLLEAAKVEDGPWYPMILTALRAGLRLGELRGVRWRDVDLVAGRIVVRVAADELSELHPPKNGKPREVPLGDDLLRVLKAHKHLRAHAFDEESGAILKDDRCRKALDRITRRAGLRQIGWHVLRHTFASHMVMRGATMKAIQELLGHGSMAMTLRYAHLSPDARRDAVRLLDGRGPRGVNGGVNKSEAEARTEP